MFIHVANVNYVRKWSSCGTQTYLRVIQGEGEDHTVMFRESMGDGTNLVALLFL
jgi:hypothetical protein